MSALEQIARLQTIIKQLQTENEQLLKVIWCKGFTYEDQLPEMPDKQYDWLFQYSKIDGVRLYPTLLVQALKAKQ